MQIVSNAGTQLKWKQAFQDAVFELDPTRLLTETGKQRRGPSKHRLSQVLSGDSIELPGN